jgi:hypothetical protein
MGDYVPEIGHEYNFLNAADIEGDFSKINIFGLDQAYNFDISVKDGVYSLIALGLANPDDASQGFANDPDALLNDPSDTLYNPNFGMGPEYYCYGADQHMGWGDEAVDMVVNGGGHMGMPGSTEILGLDVDEAAFCADWLATQIDGGGHGGMDHGMGDHVEPCEDEPGTHPCPLGMNCHQCTGHCPHRDDPESVPEPASGAALLALGAIAVGAKLKSKQG